MYRQLIKEYGLEDRTTIHPFTNHVQTYYSNAQVYVLSSRWEGFGLVLVEAMAHGLPVISSDLPTSREIMGNFGLYFRNGDAKALARQMLKVSQADWSSSSKEALEIASHFEIGNIIRQWYRIMDIQPHETHSAHKVHDSSSDNQQSNSPT
jgi:glycosyltransferase involved in cell wall biosynthesis